MNKESVDHVFIKTAHNVADSCTPIVLKSCITDHFTIFVKLELTKQNTLNRTTKRIFIKRPQVKKDVKYHLTRLNLNYEDKNGTNKTLINNIKGVIDRNTKLNKNTTQTSKKERLDHTSSSEVIKYEAEIISKSKEVPI